MPATQVIARDRHAEYLWACTSVGATIEAIATEIRHLARSEVGEVEEPFKPGQKGSSAMPHKRNPILSERLCGLARVLRGYLTAGIEDVALWHERDISHSSVERVVLPDASALTLYMLNKATGLVAGLVIHPERALANLADGSYGLVFSQSVLLALVAGGLSRDAAYRIVQRDARSGLGGAGGLPPGPRRRPRGHPLGRATGRGFRPGPGPPARAPLHRCAGRPGAGGACPAAKIEVDDDSEGRTGVTEATEALPLIQSGKVRELYDAGDDRLLMVASDRISAFDVIMAEPIADKGRVLTAMTVYWLEELADLAPNHLISADATDFPAAPRPRRPGRPVDAGAQGRHARHRVHRARLPGRLGLQGVRARGHRARDAHARRGCAMPSGCPSPSSPPRPRPPRATT